MNQGVSYIIEVQVAPWKISLHGRLTVLRPDGSSVRFTTRKAGAILAMLALEKGAPLQRSEIAAALWPGADRHEQLANLRQALRRLRFDLGAGAPFSANRESCWLIADLVEVDSTGTQLLPEMVESWFETYRAKDEIEEPLRQEANSAEALLTLLAWAARYRPREGLALVREFPDLAEMANPARLSSLLERCVTVVPPDDRLFGWGIALRAMGKALMGNVEQAIKAFERARTYSLEVQDIELNVFSTFYLSACLVLAGRTRRLRRLLDSTVDVRSRGIGQVRLRHGRGLCLIHLGDFAEGLAELRFARDLLDPLVAPYEHAYVLANLALFEASVGSIADAERALAKLKEGVGYGCVRLKLTGMLAEAILTARRGEVEPAERMLIQLDHLGSKYEMDGHRQYATEQLAVLQLQAGRKGEAQESWRLAQEIRTSNSYAWTAWDRARLRPLLQA